MSRVYPLATAGLIIALGAWPMIRAEPATAQGSAAQGSEGKPMEVITDTPEYCLHLLDRVSDLVRLATAPIPREVTDLTTEGQRMCAHGQTRGGIMRLRSALMMMEKPGGPAYR
jgi:hypothetical protein